MTAFDREYRTIEVAAPDPGVASLTIDRRADLNRITPATLDDLDAALDALAGVAPPVLIVSGAGPRAFSVGADLDALDGRDAAEAAALARRGRRTFGRLPGYGAPVIAAVDGYCLGGGMELAAHADLRIASPDATFGLPECDRGLVPGWGGTRRLRRLVGTGRAAEVVLSADEYDAEAMRRYGFVTELADDPLDRARERARALADRPPEAARAVKRALAGDPAVDAAAFGRLAARREAEDGAGSAEGGSGDAP
ncbi:MAG: enoyl-CoA hydratase/isomerase family protein [Haloferacaceae archaeon]